MTQPRMDLFQGRWSWQRWTPRLLALIAVAAVLIRATSLPAAEPVETRELANGLTVMVEQRPDSSVAAVTLAVRAGSRDDAPRRLGEVALLARALLGGSATRPSIDAVTRSIEITGGAIDLTIDAEVTRYSALVPADELDVALDTFADILLNPRFGVFDLGESLFDTLDGTYLAFDDDLAAALWPGHPAGRPAAGTEESLEAITFADLTSLRQRLFGARNVTLTVVGPDAPAAVFARAEGYFGALFSGERHPITPATAGAPLTEVQTFPTFNEQATVLLAFPTAGWRAEDFAEVALLGLLLSGPDGRLFADVRSAHGLARDVDVFPIIYSDVGALVAAARVQPQNVEATLDRFTSVFRRLREQPVTDAELQRLRDRFAGGLILVREPAAVRAYELAGDAALGRAGDTDALLAAMARVTPEGLRRTAERYLSPDRAVVHIFTPDAGRPNPLAPFLIGADGS